MGLQFNEPLFLLLLLPLIGFVYWTWRTTLRLSGPRKAFAVIARMFIALLLVFSLAGLQWFVTLKQKAVYYVIDQSASMPDSKTYLSWLQASTAVKAKNDQVGIIAMGLNSVIDRSLHVEDLRRFSFTSQVNPQFSNISQGLQLAGGLLPQEGTQRIVLITDGAENVGDMLRQGRLLKDKGIAVDVLQVSQPVRKDVALESIKLPAKLFQAEKYTLDIHLISTYAAEGELRVYEDNQEISRQSVTVERGDNRFALQSLAKDAGFHRYRAEVYFAEDQQSENNTAYSFSRVSGPPKVLIVEGADGASANITAALKSSLIPSEIIAPEMLSHELSDYAAYESIILNNVPAHRMSQFQMEMIEKAVSDYGIGLVMVGGEESFGMGGYFKTPIERALPVKMELEGKREVPSLGLILVIDRSGSMSGPKLELAKEAAIRTVELMRDKDTIGVVAFDSSPWWVVEPQKLTERKKVIEQIKSIQPAGGTEIYTAVDEAFQNILKVEAQRKHIILLTDGQSSTTQSYEQLTANMLKNNITMSSVGIGEGADVQLLEYIAKLAKGRFYFTNDQTTLPAILSRETVMMSRTYVVDKPFIPALGQLGDWAGLFAKGVPKINAYVAATPKETAEVNLLSPEPDPLLARWQYGSGRSIAWTSDFSGKWSADWIAWDQFSTAFSQMIKWTFPQFQASAYELAAHVNGDQVALDIKSSDDNSQGELKATVTDEALNTTDLSVTPTLPGEYEATMPILKPGVYLTKIGMYNAENSQVSASETSGFVIPYSPEYRIDSSDQTAKLNQLAELTGGRLLSFEHPEEVFQGEVKPRKQMHDMTRFLLITALLLWLFDIAVRRLSIPWERIMILFRIRTIHKVGTTATTVQLERLQQSKRKASLFNQPSSTTSSQIPPANAMVNDSARTAKDTNENGTSSILSRGATGPSVQIDSIARSESVNSTVDPQPANNETMNRLLAAKNRKRR